MMFHGLSNHGKYYFIIELSLIWKHNPLALSEDQLLIRPIFFVEFNGECFLVI
jgi:hypothetical protein